MVNRPKPNKCPGYLFGASDFAGFIPQNQIYAQGISTENPGTGYIPTNWTWMCQIECSNLLIN